MSSSPRVEEYETIKVHDEGGVQPARLLGDLPGD